MKNEALGVGGLVVWEVLSEGVLGEGEELVVAVALAVSLCLAFLAFGLFWWFFFRGEECHVVYCVGWDSECRVKDVQWSTMFGVDWGL